MKSFAPMLAAKTPDDLSVLKFPLLASPKLDGIRAIVRGGELLSRSLKPIPNRFVQKRFAGLPEGLDGELILGDPWDDPYRRTDSAVMSEDGEPNVIFYVFDKIEPELFARRYASISTMKLPSSVSMVIHALINNLDALKNFEEKCVKTGYEGVIVRSLDGPYKYGRSTLREGYLVKIKRYENGEAIIYGFEERMHNGNEATKNALGHTERSTHQANLVGRGDLGALLVRDIKTEVEFKIGTGFDDALRKEIWTHKSKYMAKIVRYKYFPIGGKDKPRHPVFDGWRDPRDM